MATGNGEVSGSVFLKMGMPQYGEWGKWLEGSMNYSQSTAPSVYGQIYLSSTADLSYYYQREELNLYIHWGGK